ncbi:MAG: TIR domain-containing protein [Desulfobulbaceae bacterium]|nr:TIR domain-containing protein [Desulfobulbaceae bacterium]
MKIFICNRSIEAEPANEFIDEILNISENSVAILRETEHSENWKIEVAKKIQEVDFVLFLVGDQTFESDQIKWEYAKAKQLNKQIVGVKLPSATIDSIVFCQGFQVFDNATQCLKYLERVFENDRQLLLEQYKIMVSSTEKVTEQRLKVNNLFFTVTSSILSVALVVGKTLEFSLAGTIAMVILSGMAFLVSFFWEKLINSYGNLNRGKFKVIDNIEKQLRTNMFEYEWKVLTEEIKYEPNTRTEATVIQRFRFFILAVVVFELIYVIHQLNEQYCMFNYLKSLFKCTAQ